MEQKVETLGKIRVIIADDHPAFREGLSRILMVEESLEVIGQAADGEEAIALTRELDPDVIIMDINMPRVDGIEATKKIKDTSPRTSVLMLSVYNYQAYLLAALRAGASGYLTKDTPVQELIDAIGVAYRERGN